MGEETNGGVEIAKFCNESLIILYNKVSMPFRLFYTDIF